MSLTLAQMLVLFLGPLVLATMVGIVLWLTHEKESDRLKRVEVDRAIWLKYQADHKTNRE
ncbi:hypothetical protein JRF84_19860 [Methylobacterium organophilum]|uniref:hypothetical protein n=1 Tax=Methylobacterium TaxID=407 RepID=UPI0005DF520C|nr:hypothetical protein [Methylobacterium organophilum]KZC02467.1 hypothetical protein AU375_01264 [Methylobacterium radiotolerans]MBN6821844.1 hypothetical protein [Methylobacterium organophilum]GAN50766.1 putative malate permease [Methylobacterium sp. ME121]